MNYLIFGSHGTIGESLCVKFAERGSVVRGPRVLEDLKKLKGSFDSVIWAQGINFNDSVLNFESSKFHESINTNVLFIAETIQVLMKSGQLKKGCQLIIFSSVWSSISRTNKMSYSVSKAASSGLVRSLALDLAEQGVFVNSIAPGVIDSPMTRSNLNALEIERVISDTPIKRLVTLDELSSITLTLANGEMSGMTGQEFVIDGGWSISKNV